MMGQMNPESLKGMASLLQQYGRNGDTILAHINPKEAMLLDRVSGGGSMNPMTGMPEFFNGDDDTDGGDAGGAVGGEDNPGGDPAEEGDDDDAAAGMGISEIGRDSDGTVAGEALGDAAIMGTFDPVFEAEAQAAYGVPVDQDITVSYDGGQGIGGFFDSVGNFLGKAGTTLGGIITNALENPLSTLADLAINKANPIGFAANLATQALTGRSIAAHASDALNATVGTAKTDQQPVAQALNEFATNLGNKVDNFYSGVTQSDKVGIGSLSPDSPAMNLNPINPISVDTEIRSLSPLGVSPPDTSPTGGDIDQNIIDAMYLNPMIDRSTLGLAQGGAVSLDALYNNVRARRGPITGGQRSGGGIMSLR